MPSGGTGARSAPESEKALKLVAVDPRRGAREIPLNSSPITIGSADSNDIVIADEAVSRMHARIRWALGHFLIEDMGSTNGTFLNGEKLAQAQVLKPGDHIALGRTRFKIAIADPPSRKWRRAMKVGASLASIATAAYLVFVFVTNWNMLEEASPAPATHPPQVAMAQAGHSPAPAATIGGIAPIVPAPASHSSAAVASASPAPKPGKVTPADSASAVAGVSNRGRTIATAPEPIPAMGTIEDYMKPPPAPVVFKPPPATKLLRVTRIPAAMPNSIGAAISKPWTDAEVRACSDHSKVLLALNDYRGVEQLPPVAEDATLSDAAGKHCLYLTRNYSGTRFSSLGGGLHEEQAGKPGYTPEGRLSAKRSNVGMESFPHLPQARWSVDALMLEPFHRVSLLNPDLRRVGYGQSCDPALHMCTAVLDAMGGVDTTRRDPEPLAHPTKYPASELPLHQLVMLHEWPDPLTSCPGYEHPVGVSITIQMGLWVEAKLSSYSLSHDGNPLEACGFDATSYVNPAPYDQQHARDDLRRYGAVVIVPRKPLEPGAHYDVIAVVNGQEFKWSFSTAPDATIPVWLFRKPPSTVSR